jgi:arylsulfatase A-like enzyme
MAKTGKPNILIIWGDDIDWFNISAYNHGIMGYHIAARTVSTVRREFCGMSSSCKA